MKKLVFGNAAYRALHGLCRGHMTDEQAQLQDGLVAAGWTIAGPQMRWYRDLHLSYGDSVIQDYNAATILEEVKPDVVLINDPRDWDRDSPGCFDQWTHFKNIEALADHPEIFKVVSFKDSAVALDYQEAFCAKVKANALATYYHTDSIALTCKWAAKYRQIRHYHTVDKKIIKGLDFKSNRKRGIVTGHTSPAFYPLRKEIAEHAYELGIDVRPHPGWNNGGCDVPNYLRKLSEYRVSVATSGRYGHAFRKIIESLCCGCATVTNLPKYDRLPNVFDWLLHLSPEASLDEVGRMIDFAEGYWTPQMALRQSLEAREFYDYRVDALRLDKAIVNAKGEAI